MADETSRLTHRRLIGRNCRPLHLAHVHEHHAQHNGHAVRLRCREPFMAGGIRFSPSMRIRVDEAPDAAPNQRDLPGRLLYRRRDCTARRRRCRAGRLASGALGLGIHLAVRAAWIVQNPDIRRDAMSRLRCCVRAACAMLVIGVTG